MSRTNFNLFVLFLFFGIYFVLDQLFFATVQTKMTTLLHNRTLGHMSTYALSLPPLLIGAFLLRLKDQDTMVSKFGLNGSFLLGLAISGLATLPMFIGYAFKFSLIEQPEFNSLMINTLSAGLFEELIFRAYFFGLVYRYTRLGFIPAILSTSFVFALLHLYQSQDPMELALIFTTTFLGSVLFAWLYTEWKFNLWVPIALHILMNLAWMLFDVDDNAAGNWYANIFRFLTIAIVITYTVIRAKRVYGGLQVNRKTLWRKC
ncbi:MAG: lysostaphin resistance A-like protein [Sphingobacterium sp.]